MCVCSVCLNWCGCVCDECASVTRGQIVRLHSRFIALAKDDDQQLTLTYVCSSSKLRFCSSQAVINLWTNIIFCSLSRPPDSSWEDFLFYLSAFFDTWPLMSKMTKQFVKTSKVYERFDPRLKWKNSLRLIHFAYSSPKFYRAGGQKGTILPQFLAPVTVWFRNSRIW